MLYLILYIIAFFITSIVFIVLYGSRKQEFPLFGEKFHKIPLVNIRVLKLVPTLISVLFVIFTAPRYDYFYILIILAFIFTFLGDLGIIIYNFLGLAFYYITHIFLAIAYITQIIQFSLKIIGFYSIISIGIILYLVIILYFYRFLAVNLEDKYRRTKIVITVVFLYIAFILLHIITAA
ncbi:MAG: hypothetical protein FK731_09035, partial [Asgard group archaeon]|nr:hypothetical protein [Asgard group archaeon]